MLNDIKKGDVFRCIKTVYMDDDECNVAYLEGKLYISEQDKCITDESDIIDHWWNYDSRMDFDEYSPSKFFIYLGNVANSGYNKDKITKVSNKSSRVEHPSHYLWLKNLCGIEVIDIARHLNFNLGNVLKYILRAGYKTEKGLSVKDKHIEDLKKALFYINDEIKRLENE